MIARTAPLLAALALAGCSATINESSFFPKLDQRTTERLVAPAGYTMTDELVPLTGLGVVRVVRLDRPDSEATLIYSGGNGNFVDDDTGLVRALGEAAGTDLILYDYPGRGGTTVPGTIDASIATGPALVSALRAKGWIGAGPLYGYGLSFGGSQAVAMARNGGFDGLIVEGSAADVLAVGRGMVPGLLKPFVKLNLSDAMKRFDSMGYTVAAGAPVLLISSQDDTVVRPKLMRDYGDALEAKGVAVTRASVPGDHGSAMKGAKGRAAVAAFMRRIGS